MAEAPEERIDRVKKEIEIISEKFSQGLNILVGLIKNKREAFENKDFKRLENILHNQESILEYYERKALPGLTESLNTLMKDVKLEKIREVNAFLKKLREAFTSSRGKISKDLNLVRKQLNLVSKGKAGARFRILLLKEENYLLNFFSDYDKIRSTDFGNYLKELESELGNFYDRIAKKGIYASAGAILGLVSGGMLFKLVQLLLVIGVGSDNVPAEAENIFSLLTTLVGVYGGIYMAKTEFEKIPESGQNSSENQDIRY